MVSPALIPKSKPKMFPLTWLSKESIYIKYIYMSSIERNRNYLACKKLGQVWEHTQQPQQK